MSGYRSQVRSINARWPGSCLLLGARATVLNEVDVGCYYKGAAPCICISGSSSSELVRNNQSQILQRGLMQKISLWPTQKKSSRTDLIAFDSPFVLEPGPTGIVWNENESAQRILEHLELRQRYATTCEGLTRWPVDQVVRRLQGINRYRLILFCDFVLALCRDWVC